MAIAHIHFSTIESTNTYAKQHAGEFNPELLTVLTADEQTAGRGRGTHEWKSPPGKNLYISFCGMLPKGFPSLHNNGQFLALICCLLLKEGGLKPLLKWPNDILVGGKKIAGVLSELVTGGEEVFVVNGIGLNVNLDEKECGEISESATSMSLELGHPVRREKLIKQVMNLYADHWQKFKEKGFLPFFDQFLSFCAHKKGDALSFHTDQGDVMEGLFDSLAADGSLNLQLFSGRIINHRG